MRTSSAIDIAVWLYRWWGCHVDASLAYPFSINTTCAAFRIAFGGGGAIGCMIGLGGAEFRLPLLIGLFGFPALEAVILNKAMSLIVVATALPFQAGTVPFSAIAAHWSIILNLLAGSPLGAWFGAGWQHVSNPRRSTR